MDLALIERAVERALGVAPARAHVIPTEGDSIVCEVDVGDRVVFFKSEWGANLRIARWYAQAFRTHSIPTPAILAMDDSATEFPAAFAIFEKASGRPMGRISLDAVPPVRVSRELGRYLRRIHAIDVEGVGWMRVSPDGDARGINESWAEMIDGQTIWGLTYAIKHGLLDDGVAGRVWEILRGARAVFEAAAPWHLLHGDLRPDHVFVDGGSISAIIDMQGRIGDPVYDFAHFGAQTGPGAVDLLLEGYEPDDAFRAAFDERFPLYEVVEMLGLLRWFHEHPRALTQPVVEVLPERIAARAAVLL